MLTYSRSNEFDIPPTAGLKAYQPRFLQKHIPPHVSPHSRVLEVGVGDNTDILDDLGVSEKWAVDEFQGQGGGPSAAPPIDWAAKNIRLAVGRLGTPALPLPPNHFDRVFSCSVLEHIASERWQATSDEIFRIPKPGGTTPHCVDGVIFCTGGVFNTQGAHNFDELLAYAEHFLKSGFRFLRDPRQTFNARSVFHDPDMYCLSRYAYETFWLPKIKRALPYDDFGRVVSINMGFRKP